MLNNTQAHNDMWQYCLDRIKAQTSAEEFEKWFQPIVPLEFDGTTLRLRVPNESYVRQIEKNYIPFLRPIISQLYGQQTKLHYAVPRTPAPAAAPAPAEAWRYSPPGAAGRGRWPKAPSEGRPSRRWCWPRRSPAR